MNNIKMNKTTINKFVRLWTKEYEAISLSHKLDRDLDCAYMMERPTKAIENRKATQVKKADAASLEIEKMVIDGLIGKDAVAQCNGALGNLEGYVCDCYHDVYQDALEEIKFRSNSL